MGSTSHVYYRSQLDLKNRLSRRVNDVADERWTVEQKYEALSAGIEAWGDRVRVPMVYELDLSGSEYEYTLPSFIDGPIMVQRVVTVVTGMPDSARIWENTPYWKVYPTSGGGRVLRFDFLPSDTDGRIIWWGKNGPLPLEPTLPVADGPISDSAATLTITTVPEVGSSGYIKIKGSAPASVEWVSYAGIQEEVDTLSLFNITRGLSPTVAASHTTGATVEWGVAVHRSDLYTHLMLEAECYLHNLYLHRTQSGQDKDSHMDAWRAAKQQSVEFWRTYTPARSPSMKLDRHTIGPGSWDTEIIWQQA